MPEEKIEARGESLEEAREFLKASIPEGYQLLSERIICPARTDAVHAWAETVEEAYSKALQSVPEGATILEKKELALPAEHRFRTEAFGDHAARGEIDRKYGYNVTVKDYRMTAKGKTGIFGIGQTPNVYEAVILRHALVEIKYREKARISATIGPKSTATRAKTA